MNKPLAKAKPTAMLLAILAALFYAVSFPFSKLLLRETGPVMMAAFLYLGAGLGIGLSYFLGTQRKTQGDRMEKKDLPYVIGMIVLDILAPIFLMLGLIKTPSSQASLLNNFEIVATTAIAFVIFREKVSRTLFMAIGLVTLASLLLSLEWPFHFTFSPGALLILLAATCWGLENNCTRMLSHKNTYLVVTLKGIFSGLGSLIVALFSGEALPKLGLVPLMLLLGFVSYGLSIFMYIRSQKELGAAKTSAFYALAPFLGALLSLIILGEQLTPYYFLALFVMLLGSLLLVKDTLQGEEH